MSTAQGMAISPRYLIIDWGTTNFRAFAMDVHDQVIEQKTLPLGLLQVPNGDFAAALADVLSTWLVTFEHLPIYMAGMVGSMKGWVNVDYVTTPANQAGIVSGTYSFDLPWGAKGVIFPGVSHQNGELYDVMRGEEVQLLGLVETTHQDNLHAIFPGTHAKHIVVEAANIQHFASYLTGEVFSLLTQHGLLGKGLPKHAEFCQRSFLKGVDASKDGEFTNRIFQGWTQRLFKQIDDAQVTDYLSGMLIGFELRNCNSPFYYIIGGEVLSHRYQLALKHLSIESEIIDGDQCFLAGMVTLINERVHD